ncbi:hypothetical protein [Bradyrhizobium sp.]|uniref:hypothetical protein n=1 Tax=Bradyrhizobium sp. TaxID=376 RepID=UPI0007C8D1BC|nr:hypothetical protein [Bradyrhizobium sp.]
MLPPDSFLKQVPHALESRARLILEAAGWAIDSILIAFSDLESVALATPIDQPSTELEHRLFVHCWSIVDQCHMLRSVLQRLPVVHPEIAHFVQQTEGYTFVRNSMDHLAEKLDNLVRAKVTKPPIFGVASWIRVDPENIVGGKVVGFTSWNVSSGTVLATPGWTAVRPRRELCAAEPVSNFYFEAFEHSVDLSQLIDDIRVVVEHFDTTVRARIDDGIREGARARGIDPEEVLKLKGSGGLKIGFKIAIV